MSTVAVSMHEGVGACPCWVFFTSSASEGEMSSSGAGSGYEGVASQDKAGDVRALEVEQVPGAAACSLLMAGILFSSPLSRAAGTQWIPCSSVMVPGPGQGAQ